MDKEIKKVKGWSMSITIPGAIIIVIIFAVVIACIISWIINNPQALDSSVEAIHNGVNHVDSVWNSSDSIVQDTTLAVVGK